MFCGIETGNALASYTPINIMKNQTDAGNIRVLIRVGNNKCGKIYFYGGSSMIS